MAGELIAYAELDRRWKATCKILLGGEVGGLSDYAQWLYEGNGPRLVKASEVSGKDVVLSSSVYPENARYISYDEAETGKAYAPLSINEMKDIDSLLSAVSERMAYSGNIVLGNSRYVEQSSTITECFYALHCERVAFCKYIAYCTRGGYSENAFGCYGFGPTQFVVRSMASWNCTRCLNVSRAYSSSDIYFSHGITNCSDCMFCFNVKNKRRAIGNLELPKEKYAQLKAKLLAEIREKLEKEKRLPSLIELVAGQKPDYGGLKRAMASAKPFPTEKTDKGRIEEAFSKTTAIVLGKALAPIDAYSGWLSENSNICLEDGKSCATGTALIVPDYAHFLQFPRDRLITQDEAEFLGQKLALEPQEAESVSLQNAPLLLNKIAYFCPSWLEGNLRNNIDTPLNIDSSDCYRGTLYLLSKLSAFCFSPRSCEYSFGCREPRESSFCINCHFSTNVTRSFETDHCSNCSGVYFCHNCENVHDSMFCFNAKNLKYAIGNVEVGREKFLEVKKRVLGEIVGRLEKERAFPLSIYSLGRVPKRKRN